MKNQPVSPRLDKGFIQRLTDPIPSFPGKAPTAEEQKMIDSMRKYLDTQNNTTNSNNSKN